MRVPGQFEMSFQGIPDPICRYDRIKTQVQLT